MKSFLGISLLTLGTLILILILLEGVLLLGTFLYWLFIGRLTPESVQIVFTIRGKKETHMQLKVNDQLPISIQAADEFGNPTPANFDSPPVWTSSDAMVAVIATAVDGLSAIVTSPLGKLASATIQVAGTVNGQGVQGSLQLDMVAGDTAEIVLAPGAATPAPAPSV